MRYIIGIFIGGFLAVLSPTGQTFFTKSWVEVHAILTKVWPVVQDKLNTLLG